MSRHGNPSRRRSYGQRRHDLRTRPDLRREPADTDYLGREVAPETELERRARDGDR